VHTDGKIGAVQFTPATPGAPVHILDHRRAFLIEPDAFPRAKSRANATGFAPGPVNIDVKMLFDLAQWHTVTILRFRGSLSRSALFQLPTGTFLFHSGSRFENFTFHRKGAKDAKRKLSKLIALILASLPCGKNYYTSAEVPHQFLPLDGGG
jgi:hypothetical protein